MTVTPTVRGFPDFMYPNGAAAAAVFRNSYLNSGNVGTGFLDVSSWPVVELNVGSLNLGGGATYFQVQYEWYDPSSLASTVCVERVYVQSGTRIRDSKNCKSGILRISLIPSPAGTFTGDVFVVARAGVPGIRVTEPTLCVIPFQVVASFAGVSAVAADVSPGYATVQANGYTSSQFFTALDVLTTGNVWIPFWGRANPAGLGTIQAEQVYLPSSQVRLRVGNNSGAAINMDAALVPMGY